MNKNIYIFNILILLPTIVNASIKGDSIPEDIVNLDEIVIKSFKQDKRFRLLPVSASTANSSYIKNHNVYSIKEFSAFIPNLFMPDYGSKLTSPVYIRGIGSKINSPSVGLYVDGIPYFEKSAFDFCFTEVERFEVLRGPQGTLYGRNTMGGIINVYTKSPLNLNGSSASVSYGSYGQTDINVSHYNKIAENIGYSISSSYSHSDGFFTNEYNGKEVDKSNSWDGRSKLEWKISEKTKLGLSSVFDRSLQGGYPYAIYNKNYNSTGNVNYNDYSYYRRSLSTTGATLEHTGRKFSINNKTAFQYISDHQGIDQDFSPKQIYFAKQNQKQRMLSEEFNIKSTDRGKYRWLFGAFGFYQNIGKTVILDYLSKGYSTYKYYDTSTMGVAVYHQSVIDDIFTDGLSLTLGLRYDYEQSSNDYSYDKLEDGAFVPVNNLDSKLHFSQFTPKIALQYIFQSSGTIYANVSKGYKTGGFNTSFDTDDERTFKPETSWNYEIGAKHPFMDKCLNAEITFFWIDWKNQQIHQTVSTGKGSLLKNAGKSCSKGVELSIHYNPINGLLLNVSYGYTHAKFRSYTDEHKGIDYSHNFLPMVPSHTLGASVSYMKFNPLPFLDQLSINMDFSGNGKLYWKEDNQISQPFYGIVNANLSLKKNIVTWGIWAKNITNTKYNSFYFESMGNGLAQKGKPFCIGGKVAIDI